MVSWHKYCENSSLLVNKITLLSSIQNDCHSLVYKDWNYVWNLFSLREKDTKLRCCGLNWAMTLVCENLTFQSIRIPYFNSTSHEPYSSRVIVCVFCNVSCGELYALCSGVARGGGTGGRFPTPEIAEKLHRIENSSLRQQ